MLKMHEEIILKGKLFITPNSYSTISCFWKQVSGQTTATSKVHREAQAKRLKLQQHLLYEEQHHCSFWPSAFVRVSKNYMNQSYTSSIHIHQLHI